MQILPSTGEWIASNLSIEEYSSEDLFDPEVNIRFGCFYLAYLHTRFSDDWAVYAAYNAGEGRVERWLDSGVTRDTVPIEETKEYIRRVERALINYRNKKFATNH